MTLALTAPERVGRLLVADIAPVPISARERVRRQRDARDPAAPSLTRAEAEAALADAVPLPAVRTFLI